MQLVKDTQTSHIHVCSPNIMEPYVEVTEISLTDTPETMADHGLVCLDKNAHADTPVPNPTANEECKATTARRSQTARNNDVVEDYWRQASEERRSAFRQSVIDAGLKQYKESFNSNEAATLIGVSRWTLCNTYCYEGTIKAYKRGRNWYFSASAIFYFLNEGHLPRERRPRKRGRDKSRDAK